MGLGQMPVKEIADGRYQLQLGKSGDQQKFMLGRDQAQATIRGAYIESVYRQTNAKIHVGWIEPMLSICKAIAKGEPEYTLDTTNLEPVEVVFALDELQRHLPIIKIVPSIPAKEIDGRLQWRNRIAQAMNFLGSVAHLGKVEVGSEPIKGTLHSAFNDYIEKHIKAENIDPKTRRLTNYGELRILRVKRFIRDLPNHQLSVMNFDKCDEALRFYKNRPANKRTGKPVSVKDAQHCIKELRRFFRWLDVRDNGWEMPRGLMDQTYRVALMDEEKKLSAFVKVTYTVDQLATIARHCTPMDRMMLFVGLNCAMGAAELGRITTDEIVLGQPHPHAERLGMGSEPADYIRNNRRKAVVFGEWRLWPETVSVIQWGMARAKNLGTDVLFCANTGSPMYNEMNRNPQQNFANTWSDIIKRVRKSHPDFPYLPFGSLRDTLPDLVRQKFDGELASMLVSHGSPFKGDNLLECYSNKPYGRLHSAVMSLRETFLPVLTAPSAYTSQSKRYRAIEGDSTT